MPALALSNEFRLALACCRWPRSQGRDAAVAGAVAAGIDWARFLRIVRRQRVEGFARDALVHAEVAVPADVSDALASTAGAIAMRSLAFAAEAVRLGALFDAAGIAFLFVKGVTLAKLAYGEIGLKQAFDIDMAVPPELVGESCALLAGAGYVRSLPGPEISEEHFRAWMRLSKDSEWRHDGKGAVVELHARLTNNKLLLPGLGARSARQWVEIAPGKRLPTLQTDELFAYLCVHGAAHAWSRIKWLVDVAALLSHADEAEIARLYRESVRLGAGRCAAQALLLCADLFGTSVGGALRRELERDRATRWLVGVALKTMAGKYADVEYDESMLGTVPIQLSHFAFMPGWRYKSAELGRKLGSPHDRMLVPLPRALHFLYPLLLVPLWLWRRRAAARQG